MDSNGSSSGLNPQAPPRGNKPNYVQQTKAQVDEVVDIMKTNVEKVIERDAKLNDLDQRAGTLAEGANQFEKKAVRLKRKLWWKNVKLMIIIGSVAVIFILLVIWLGF